MQGFVEKLKESDNDLLKNEAKGIELFRNLKHDKPSLEIFLENSVAEILTSSRKILICTSNEQLVKKFSPNKVVGAPVKQVQNSIFKTSSRHNALTWDLIKNKYASIAGNSWQILNFIVIDESNVEILHRTIEDLLKKVQSSQ